MFIALILLGTLANPAPLQVVQTWNRPSQFQIPLRYDTGIGTFGEVDRKADHATVATNSVGDVLIAFHSSRENYDTRYPLLKQVEIALVTYDSNAQTWELDEQNQAVVGSVAYSPLSLIYSQVYVKCERPDVIAVGEWFFVVWTRIYQREYGSGTPSDQIREPAVLECAWVKKNSSGQMEIYTDGNPAGLGYELDKDIPGVSRFHVRECAGCPDAVMLHPGDPGATPPILPTVGIVYPHQTDFGDLPGNSDEDRLFELRFRTCSIDPTNPTNPNALSFDVYPAIVAYDGDTTGIVYDGDNSAAGIVLPDVAPASVPWRFGLAYEEQIKTATVTNGRILLQTWDLTPAVTSLTMLESHAFGSSSSTFYRRRPMLSSYPSAFPDQDVFALAFNKLSTTGEGDVIYQEWDLTDGAHLLAWEFGWAWDQGCDDKKPVPLLGRELYTGKYFGRCYAECTTNNELINYVRLDANNEDTPFSIVIANQLQRPAASYWYDAVYPYDNVALTWEQETTVGTTAPVQIWLRME